MRLLTPDEYALLRECAEPCLGGHVTASEAERVIFSRLIRDRRIYIGTCCGDSAYLATAEGMEALRLWPIARVYLEAKLPFGVAP